jgi:hypothetical protein
MYATLVQVTFAESERKIPEKYSEFPVMLLIVCSNGAKHVLL